MIDLKDTQFVILFNSPNGLPSQSAGAAGAWALPDLACYLIMNFEQIPKDARVWNR